MRIYFLAATILAFQFQPPSNLLAEKGRNKIKDDWCACSSVLNPPQPCKTDQDCSGGAPGNGVFCNKSSQYNCSGAQNVCWYNGC